MSLRPCPGQSITPEPPPTLPGRPGEPFLLRGQQGLSPCSVPGTPSPHTASGSWASSPVRWGHAAGQGGEVHQGCVDRHRELRETRSPNVAICPEAQSGHTAALAGPRGCQTVRRAHTDTRQRPRLLRVHAHQPTLTHSHAHTRAHTPRVPATPRNFLPPAPQCPQLPFRLKLFRRWRQGSAERLDRPGLPGLGRPAPGAPGFPPSPPRPSPGKPRHSKRL